MNIVLYRNELTGAIENEYKTQFLEPLHPELPDNGPKITELWVDQVIHWELVADDNCVLLNKTV